MNLAVNAKREELKGIGLPSLDCYTTNGILERKVMDCAGKIPMLTTQHGDSIYLEIPFGSTMEHFYREHGLTPAAFSSSYIVHAISMIANSIEILCDVNYGIDVSKFVRCIQVIESDGEDFDTSYSHPEIPFTIFVSLCHEKSQTTLLRLAESILHETMHLKLTLLEKLVPMTSDELRETHFSPWRGVQRPVRGVLHGLFVFRCIYDFYSSISTDKPYSESDYVKSRLTDIKKEIAILQDFPLSPGLTSAGKTLATNLVKF